MGSRRGRSLMRTLQPPDPLQPPPPPPGEGRSPSNRLMQRPTQRSQSSADLTAQVASCTGPGRHPMGTGGGAPAGGGRPCVWHGARAGAHSPASASVAGNAHATAPAALPRGRVPRGRREGSGYQRDAVAMGTRGMWGTGKSGFQLKEGGGEGVSRARNFGGGVRKKASIDRTLIRHYELWRRRLRNFF